MARDIRNPMPRNKPKMNETGEGWPYPVFANGKSGSRVLFLAPRDGIMISRGNPVLALVENGERADDFTMHSFTPEEKTDKTVNEIAMLLLKYKENT